MKKNFIEPEVVRIELQMTENIATSGSQWKKYLIGNDYDPLYLFYTREYDINGIPCRERIMNTNIGLYPLMPEDVARGYVSEFIVSGCLY